MEPIRAVKWGPGYKSVRIIDQRLLPGQYVERDLATIDEIEEAIKTLAVRGAPAIGVTAALGFAVLLAQKNAIAWAFPNADRLRNARPTAVNLKWAIDRMMAAITGGPVWADVPRIAREEANDILEEDREMCRRMGEAGATLIPHGARILTHCNAGALATSGIGTALAPVYIAAEDGRRVEVFADETRPLMQGARLTAWELSRAGIPVTVLPDSAAASLMRAGKIDMVLVGADRIAANGDAANKIGTYSLAIAAKRHGIPFYVVAPTSTFDPKTGSGDAIPIEERGREELANVPAEANVFNPAFDVTPAELITAFVSDRGVHHPPYRF